MFRTNSESREINENFKKRIVHVKGDDKSSSTSTNLTVLELENMDCDQSIFAGPVSSFHPIPEENTEENRSQGNTQESENQTRAKHNSRCCRRKYVIIILVVVIIIIAALGIVIKYFVM